MAGAPQRFRVPVLEEEFIIAGIRSVSRFLPPLKYQRRKELTMDTLI